MALGLSETLISLGDPTFCDRKVKSKAEAGKFTNTCQHQEVAWSLSFLCLSKLRAVAMLSTSATHLF